VLHKLLRCKGFLGSVRADRYRRKKMEPRPALFYEGPHYMYSNFSSFMVDWRGRRWQTAEHAYQAEKFSEDRARHVEKRIEKARSAHEAKKIAKEFEAYKRPDWDSVKLGVMEQILRAKLAQHEYIRKKLLETGERLIVEDSPTDNFWGRGPDWKGANHLGKLWMKLRAELRSGAFVY